MNERRFYIDGDRQMVAGPGEPSHEADPDDPDLLRAQTFRKARLETGDVIHTDLGPLVIPEGMGGHYVVADSLDAAWAEAEAALPEGWALTLTPDTTEPDTYVAEGRPRDPFDSTRTGDLAWGAGPTPAAALRALAAQLRQCQA